jgi:hypothetical protein
MKPTKLLASATTRLASGVRLAVCSLAFGRYGSAYCGTLFRPKRRVSDTHLKSGHFRKKCDHLQAVSAMHLELLRIRVRVCPRLGHIEINREQQGCSWGDVSTRRESRV